MNPDGLHTLSSKVSLVKSLYDVKLVPQLFQTGPLECILFQSLVDSQTFPSEVERTGVNLNYTKSIE